MSGTCRKASWLTTTSKLSLGRPVRVTSPSMTRTRLFEADQRGQFSGPANAGRVEIDAGDFRPEPA